MSQIQVTPELLERASDRADAMAVELRAGVRDVEPETTAAARGLDGWSTGSTLTQTGTDWTDKLTDLSNRMGGVSDKLTRTASNYRNADERGSDRFGG